MAVHRAHLRWETKDGVFHLSGQAVRVSQQRLEIAAYDAVPTLTSVSCVVPALELSGRALVRSVRRAGFKLVTGIEFFGTPQEGF